MASSPGVRGWGWASYVSSETVQADQVYWRLLNKFRDSTASFYTFSSYLFHNHPIILHCTACSVHHIGGLMINTNTVHSTQFNYREFTTETTGGLSDSTFWSHGLIGS